MRIYLMRDSILMFSRVYEYQRDHKLISVADMEDLAERLKNGQKEEGDDALMIKLQDMPVREDKDRRRWNERNPTRHVPLLCDTDIVSRSLLEAINTSFKTNFLEDESIVQCVGTENEKWDTAMDNYVADVVTEMERDVEERILGNDGSPEREMHQQSPFMFRILYSRVAGRPRALPVITPSMLDEIISKVKTRPLAMTEVSSFHTQTTRVVRRWSNNATETIYVHGHTCALLDCGRTTRAISTHRSTYKFICCIARVVRPRTNNARDVPNEYIYARVVGPWSNNASDVTYDRYARVVRLQSNNARDVTHSQTHIYPRCSTAVEQRALNHATRS